MILRFPLVSSAGEGSLARAFSWIGRFSRCRYEMSVSRHGQSGEALDLATLLSRMAVSSFFEKIMFLLDSCYARFQVPTQSELLLSHFLWCSRNFPQSDETLSFLGLTPFFFKVGPLIFALSSSERFAYPHFMTL